MTEQTQTEKLGMKLIGNVQDIYWLGRDKCRLSDDQINLEIARILQACKESGLVWYDGKRDKFEEIEIE